MVLRPGWDVAPFWPALANPQIIQPDGRPLRADREVWLPRRKAENPR